ncbi:MAG: glycosyltransferase [SAR324 cluster bacterium]|nr:glycosyltransferase [SAR324 cluster bacterium]
MKFPENFEKFPEIPLWSSSLHAQSSNFQYSDGDDAENYMLQAVRDASDLGPHSIELQQKIKDWSSEYHFSFKRSNLLRPFNLSRQDTVLELGCGCGAITRYLGETCGEVVAVEGSLRRAEIAAQRCRNLNNVTVIQCNFQELELNRTFDVVTLIGVLEYSGMFLNGENPYLQCLEMAGRYLSPEGILVIAIENKLGLKYLAGCSEEHTSKRYRGIEGYSTDSKVSTFGKDELHRLLRKSGLIEHELFIPFPDYKLPDGMMAFSRIKPQPEAPFLYQWFSYERSRDYSLIQQPGFNEFLVAREFEANGLLEEIANSFVVIAGKNPEALKRITEASWWINKYNVSRAKPYMTSLSMEPQSDRLVIKKQPIYPEIRQTFTFPDGLNHDAEEIADFIPGTPLIEKLLRDFASGTYSLITFLRDWLEFLNAESRRLNCAEGELPGNYIDCVPWNIMEQPDGTQVYFDREWKYGETLSVKFIFTRGLIFIYHWFHRKIYQELFPQLNTYSFHHFYHYCFNELSLGTSEEEFESLMKLEWNFQKMVNPEVLVTLVSFIQQFKQEQWNRYGNLDYYLEHAKENIQQLNTQIEQLNTQIEHLHTQMDKSNARLLEYHYLVKRMEATLAWRTHVLLRTMIKQVPRQTLQFLKKKTPLARHLVQQHGWKYFIVYSIKWFARKIHIKTRSKWRTLQWKTHYRLSHIDFLHSYLPQLLPYSPDPAYYSWLIHNYPQNNKLKDMQETMKKWQYHPLISIIVPTYNSPENFLREMIQSVRSQIYSNWELCIADDASSNAHIRTILEDYRKQDSRIKICYREQNGHICHASNSALELATGEYIALLDHDDLLTPHALYKVVELLNKHSDVDMIYSDEDKVDESGYLKDPYFKADWSPDTFLSRMYTCHLGVYRRSLIDKIGGFRPGFEGAQDYDLVLRLTEQTKQIFHIPDILYHWRIHSGSTAMGGQQIKPYAYVAAEKALKEALERRGEPGTVKGVEQLLGSYEVRYQIQQNDLVSIIIPTRDLSPILERCLRSIVDKTLYPNYEIILLDNGSREQETLDLFDRWKINYPTQFHVVRHDVPFNYSIINNHAVRHSKGKYLLFLNNDTEVITPDWISAMLEQAQRPSIGAVGAMLLYPDDTIQHGGVVLGLGGAAAHSHRCFPSTSPGYVGHLWCVTNYSAVTAACLMCRRDVFEEIGGFEETLAGNYNDVDLCLKMVAKGYRNVYLPHVKLYHHESKSRGKDTTPEKQARFLLEFDYLRNKWPEFIEHDPCYNPHLTRNHEDYSIRTQ